MARPAPTLPSAPGRLTSQQYLRLVEQGVLRPEDRVELPEGVVVAMAHGVEHAAGVRRVDHALKRAVGDRAAVQVQLSLVQGEHSVPEPDVAVLPGRLEDYDDAHPTTAVLVVEVADSSLPQDRLTKGAISAHYGIGEYWIANLRDVRVLGRPASPLGRSQDHHRHRPRMVQQSREPELPEADEPGAWSHGRVEEVAGARVARRLRREAGPCART